MELKYSNLPWIGNIPKLWRIEKIKFHLVRDEQRNPGDKQVLSVYREYGVIPKESRDDNHNVTSEDVSKYKWVKPGDFVINKMKAWQGSMGLSRYEGIVSPAYFIYKPKSNLIYGDYIHYLFRNCYKNEFRRLSGGIREGQWDLSSNCFENTLFPIPSLIEQKKITVFLNNECNKINEINLIIEEQMNTLEEYKRSLIIETVTKGLNPNVNYKDSNIEWIGEIPEHWQLRRNKYNFMLDKKIVGADWKSKQLLSLTKNGIKKINDGEQSGKVPTSFSTYQNVEVNDIVMCLFDLDCSAVFSGLSKYEGMISPAYKCFKCNNDVLPEFVNYYFMAVFIDRKYMRYSKNVRYSLSSDEFLALPIIIPPLSEQKAIADYLDGKCGEIDEIIDGKRKQLEILKEYKQSVIYEYVTGKKEVSANE